LSNIEGWLLSQSGGNHLAIQMSTTMPIHSGKKP